MKRRYIKWDYDNNTAIEYERQGECNLCGQCCFANIRYRVAGRRTNGSAAMGVTTDREGVWSEVSDGRMRRFVKLTEITERGSHKCSAHGEAGCTKQSDKSLRLDGDLALCDAWPIIPEHVDAFDECSYTFKEIGRWPIKPGSIFDTTPELEYEAE